MAKLRPVLTRDEIITAISGFTADTNIWIEKESQRKEEYTRILKSGDHKKVIYSKKWTGNADGTGTLEKDGIIILVL